MNKVLQSPIQILRELVLSSFENFIHYFQKEYSGYKPNLYDYQKIIVSKMEDVLRGKITRLNINIPPRYRKTEIAVKMFIAYGLAKNPKAKFIHLSYSKSLALDNSEAVKDMISSHEYQTLFPEVRIKKDSKAKEKWYTTEGGGVYATSAGGQVTGFGAGSSPEEYEEDDVNFDDFLVSGHDPESFGGAVIIDDANKPEDAESPLMLKKINQRFDSTIKNRVNSRFTPIINIQQRIASKDLSGYLQGQKNPKGEKVWENLVLPAIDGNGNALCEAIHTKEELLQLKEENEGIFNTQYLQNPIPLEGLMYPVITRTEITLEELLKGAELLFSTTDANMTDGNDYFVTWFWAIYEGRIFIYDVIYEKIAAKNIKERFIQQHNHYSNQIAVIEQNNQQTFIGEVEFNIPSAVLPITAKGNKLSRILAKAYLVKHIAFCKEGTKEFEKAIEHLENFQKNGDSDDKHDDAEDALTLGLDYLWNNYRHIFLQ